MTTHANNARAMLIGVDNYRAFDPEGRRDLRGSVNDVRAWWDVCRALGIAPANVCVLASPAPGAPRLEIDGVHVEEATRENILKGIAWLAQGVGNQEKRTGLLTYSGHGAFTDNDLALCPSDVTPGDDGPPRNLIEFAAVKRALHSAEGLTIVLDTCFAGAAAPLHGALALNRGPVPEAIFKALTPRAGGTEMAHSPLGGRLLLGCGLDQVAYQANFAGRVHGAFTWALTSALLQWSGVQQDATTRLDLSYATARQTAGKLLEALSFKQAPVLAPAAVAQLSVFQADGVAQPTSVLPDGQVRPLQVDPGDFNVRFYTIVDQNGAVLAYILVPFVTGTYNFHTYRAGTEYWFSVAESVSNTTQMTVSWSDYYWSSTAPVIPANLPLAQRSFTMTQGATFSASSTPPSSSTCFVDVGANIAVDWGTLTYSAASPHWSGTLTWYDTSGLDNVFGSGTSSPQVLKASTTDSNRVTWYDASVRAVSIS